MKRDELILWPKSETFWRPFPIELHFYTAIWFNVCVLAECEVVTYEGIIYLLYLILFKGESYQKNYKAITYTCIFKTCVSWL